MMSEAMLPETWIEVVGLTIIVIGPVAASKIFGSGHRKTSEDDEARAEVEAAVQAGVDLAPTVATMGAAIERMQAEIAALQSRIAAMLPISEVKYPAALDTVARYRSQHPDSPVRIAPEIIEDLSKR